MQTYITRVTSTYIGLHTHATAQAKPFKKPCEQSVERGALQRSLGWLLSGSLEAHLETEEREGSQSLDCAKLC